MGVVVAVGVNQQFSLRLRWAGARIGRALFGGAAIAALLTICLLPSAQPALAVCTQVGSNVVCANTTFNYDSGAQANLAVTVQQDAAVIGTGNNDAIRITSTTNATLTNNGLIDGFVTILSDNPGSDTFTNNGILKITDPTEPLQEHSMVGTNFIQTANGTFLARVDANLLFDGIFSRSANLNGKLIVVVQPDLYDLVTTYDQFIITLTGTVGGFSSIETTSPFFSAITVVNGNDLDLVLSRVGFGSVTGMTPNQRAVGNALEPGYSTTLTGNAATFYSNLLAANSVTVLDQLSGEGTSGTQHAAFGAGSLFNNAMQNQSLFGPGLGGLSVVVPPAQYAQSRVTPGHDAFASIKKRRRRRSPSPAAGVSGPRASARRARSTAKARPAVRTSRYGISAARSASTIRPGRTSSSGFRSAAANRTSRCPI